MPGGGLVSERQLAAELRSEWPTQRGLAWWQPSEPREKNHRVNLCLPVGLLVSHTSLHYIHIHIVLVLLLL